ncbi:hypothetical protein [Kocuria sabuli]|uniref:hypothetical protein n=1 Tax=Kocuria sabuli TaxID=3071448 RepID=UPI0034D4E988
MDFVPVLGAILWLAVGRNRGLDRDDAVRQTVPTDEAGQAGHRAMVPGHVVILVLAVVCSAVILAGMSGWLILSLCATTAATLPDRHRGAPAAAAVTARPSV